ncbi:MAG: hypothetical protein D6681_08055, partial [Calditrichaeota bacterium]
DRSGRLVVAGAEWEGVYVSQDGGNSWFFHPETLFYAGGYITFKDVAFTPTGTILLAANAGLFRSTDKGRHWERLPIGPCTSLLALPDGRVLVAADLSPPMRVSNDDGKTWEPMAEGLPFYLLWVSLGRSPDGTIYALAETQLFRFDPTTGQWIQLHSWDEQLFTFTVNSRGHLFAAQLYALYRSTDGGQTWTLLTDTHSWAQILALPENKLVAATGRGVIYSADEGETWEKIGLPVARMTAITAPGTEYVFATVENRGFYRYHLDRGIWEKVRGSTWASGIAGTGDYIYGAGGDGAIQRSTDGGDSWESLDFPPPGRPCCLRLVDEQTLYVGTTTGRVYRWLGAPGAWEQLGASFGDRRLVHLQVDSTGRLWAGTTVGLFRWNPGTGQWDREPFPPTTVQALLFTSGGTIFVGTRKYGLLRKAPEENFWQRINEGISHPNIRVLLRTSEGVLLAGSEGGGVFYSTNEGDTWHPLNAGLDNRQVRDLALTDDRRLFAATYGGSVYQMVFPSVGELAGR